MNLPVMLSHQIAAEHQMGVLTGDLSIARLPGGQQSKIMFKQFIDSKGNAHPQEMGTYRNVLNGAIKPTASPLDFGLVGEGYFKISTPEGVRYTRNGRGRLVNGEIVIGKNGKLMMEGGGPLNLGDASPDELAVNSDFTVSIRGEIIGKLGVARFEKQQRMRYLPNEHLYTTEEEPLPATNEAGELLVNVQQNAYEQSNISPTDVMMTFMQTQRRFTAIEEMMKKTHTVHNEAVQSYLKIAI